MIGFLSKPQREYVLFHLGHHIAISEEIGSRFFFANSISDVKGLSSQIVFLGSDRDFFVEEVKYIDGLPILFPASDREDFYYIDECKNIIFNHDVLKSIFYLLSGYQEYFNQGSKDRLSRFSLADSVQYKLNIVHKPIVNYYLARIAEGIREFCSFHNAVFTKRQLFQNFGFLLSHDIDLVDTYTVNYFLYKFKEIFHIRKSQIPSLKNLILAVKGMLKYFRILKRDNPYWSFDFMRSLERKNNFKSTFYFLDKDVLHSDAYYSFDEKRMVELYASLQAEKCEIGLHGTVRSVDNVTLMEHSLAKLKGLSKASIKGIRQHRLLWKHPSTAIIQKSIGLEYDTTLGFAAHEGFRNSYCGPFKLYDFAKDEALDFWEYPLNVMDVSLFAYQNYAPSIAMEKCIDLIEEVRKFNGIFTVLWHNSFFDEDVYPGVTKFYEDLLAKVASYKPENVTGLELLSRLKEFK